MISSSELIWVMVDQNLYIAINCVKLHNMLISAQKVLF